MGSDEDENTPDLAPPNGFCRLIGLWPCSLDEDSLSDWSTDSCGWSDDDIGVDLDVTSPPLSGDSVALDTSDQEIVRCVCEVEEENDFMIQVCVCVWCVCVCVVSLKWWYETEKKSVAAREIMLESTQTVKMPVGLSNVIHHTWLPGSSPLVSFSLYSKVNWSIFLYLREYAIDLFKDKCVVELYLFVKLMYLSSIQCEECLCWQHGTCMGLLEENVPDKYACYICRDPPGERHMPWNITHTAAKNVKMYVWIIQDECVYVEGNLEVESSSKRLGAVVPNLRVSWYAYRVTGDRWHKLRSQMSCIYKLMSD